MGALHGLKILDFSTLLPGPYATMVLADLGAEVLHVVRPGAYDLYETADGRYLSVCSLEPKFYRALCKGLDRPEWLDGKVWRENPEETKRGSCASRSAARPWRNGWKSSRTWTPA